MTRGDLRFVALLVLGILLAYAPGLGGPPVFDDASVLQARVTPSDFLQPLPHRSLTQATFALSRTVAGNLLIHVLTALLALHLTRRLGAALGEKVPAFAWCAGAWFALHPVGVQVAGYLAQRSAGLETLLAFLTMSLYLKGREAPSPWRSAWIWGALASALLAMGAKETAVTIPLLLLAVEWALGRKDGWLARWLPFAILPCLALPRFVMLIRAAGHPVSGGNNMRAFLSWVDFHYLLRELPIMLGYLRLHAFPFPLHFTHASLPYSGWHALVDTPLTTASAGALLLLTVWILFGPERHRVPRLGMALFLAPLALESSIFPIEDEAFVFRSYPSLLGSGLCFAWAAVRLTKGRIVLAGGVLLLLAALTATESRRWTDSLGLTRRDLRAVPEHCLVWYNYAMACLDKGLPARAEAVTRRGLRIPFYPQIRAVRIQILLTLGRLREAREEIARYESSCPGNTFPLHARLDLACRTGDDGEAERLADRLEALPGTDSHFVLWLAGHRLSQGRPVDAERVLRKHQADMEGQAAFWECLAAVLRSQGRDREACEAESRARLVAAP